MVGRAVVAIAAAVAARWRGTSGRVPSRVVAGRGQIDVDLTHADDDFGKTCSPWRGDMKTCGRGTSCSGPALTSEAIEFDEAANFGELKSDDA